MEEILKMEVGADADITLQNVHMTIDRVGIDRFLLWYQEKELRTSVDYNTMTHLLLEDIAIEILAWEENQR